MSVEFAPANVEYIDCGSDGTVDNIFAAGGSVACWVKLANEPGDNEYWNINNKFTSGQGDGWNWGAWNASGATSEDKTMMFFQANSGGNLRITGPDNFLVGDAGEWHHWVVTYDESTSDPKFYYDGVAVDMTVQNGGRASSNDSSRNFLISRDTSVTRTFDGELEDNRVYKRILTGPEILTLASGHCDPLGGEALWITLKEASAISDWIDGQALVNGVNLLTDLSGNGNHGDPVATPVTRPFGFDCLLQTRNRSKRHLLGML